MGSDIALLDLDIVPLQSWFCRLPVAFGFRHGGSLAANSGRPPWQPDDSPVEASARRVA